LLLITDSNDVYNLDRLLISTRRPSKSYFENVDADKDNSHFSASLKAYEYFLPFNSLNVLNADWKLNDMKSIIVDESKFESTSLVFAYGSDLFFARVSPDGNYDRLDENFNYPFLVLLVIGMSVS
jgi:ER membrane protein complex subunit 1, C-terminal